MTGKRSCTETPEAPSRLTAVCLALEAQRALETPFTLTGASFAGNLAPVGNDAGPIPVAECGLAFGESGTAHAITVAGQVESLVVEELVSTHKHKNAARKLVNFFVIKFRLMGINVSVKLYTTRYFQIFGLADLDNVCAEDLARSVMRFVADFLNSTCNARCGTVTDISLIATSARHEGLVRAGLRLDLEILASAFTERHHGNPDFVVKVNHRNGSLNVRLGATSGSQMFHGTGTIQLMGVQGDRSDLLTELRSIIAANPKVVETNPNPMPRKKRSRSSAGAAKKRALAVPLNDGFEMHRMSRSEVEEALACLIPEEMSPELAYFEAAKPPSVVSESDPSDASEEEGDVTESTLDRVFGIVDDQDLSQDLKQYLASQEEQDHLSQLVPELTNWDDLGF